MYTKHLSIRKIDFNEGYISLTIQELKDEIQLGNCTH